MFHRNCEEALSVYEKAFNTKVTEMRKYKDMPPNPNFPIPESEMNLVLHARVDIEGSELMCADSSKDLSLGNNMYVSLTTSNEDMVKQAWELLKEDGKIYLELSPTFFAKQHGHLQDRFGINWMFTVQ
jgi:PhnB protein